MIESRSIDPAVVDRRSELLAGIDAGTLPRRRMTIAGMEGSVDAVILSKDQKGPATRLIDFDAGWGSGVPGAFTEDVEIFVLDGEISLGGVVLGSRDHARIDRGGVLGGMRTMSRGRALFMTGAPVRYDTARGGRAASLEITHSAEVRWEPVPASPGLFSKPLGSARAASLVGFLEWEASGEPWRVHDVAEEVFVVEGEVTVSEWSDGTSVSHTYRPGGYLWRPAGALHAGPGSLAPDTALVFVRRPGGPGSTDLVAVPVSSPGDPGR